MKTPALCAAAVTAVALLTAALPGPADRAPEAAITMTPTAYGCDITVRAHNKGTAGVTIDLEDSEVKVRNGVYSKLNQGGSWVVNAGGEHESKVVSLDLPCSFDRRYKFLMRSGGDQKYIYFPGPDLFTRSVSLGLANVGRHF